MSDHIEELDETVDVTSEAEALEPTPTPEPETNAGPRKPWDAWVEELDTSALDSRRGRLWARLPIGAEVTRAQFEAAVKGGRNATAR